MKCKDHLFSGLHIYRGRFRVRVYPDHAIGVAIRVYNILLCISLVCWRICT